MDGNNAAVRPAADEDAMLWHCASCQHSGVLLTARGANSYDVIEALEKVHHAQAPQCADEFRLGGLHVTRPYGWFKSITDFVEAAVPKLSRRRRGQSASIPGGRNNAGGA